MLNYLISASLMRAVLPLVMYALSAHTVWRTNVYELQISDVHIHKGVRA